jgi:hypothetical protein
MISASASYSPFVMQYSTITDLISAVVDESTERFMTLPQSFDRSKPSPSPQRLKHALSRERVPGHIHAESQVASPSSIHKDVTESLQVGFLGLGSSSEEQEVLIREQERMLSQWNASLCEQELSIIDSIPLTAQQSYVDCEAGRVELYPRKCVRMHHNDYPAYASLANGDVAIFKCAGCENCLLATQDTKLLYCSECGTLTPTEIPSTCSTNNGHNKSF